MNQQFGNQMDRIHQNSLFNGGEQNSNFGQVNQIHQRTMSGNMSNPLRSGFGGGFGGQSFQQQSQGYNQGFQNQVNQNQVDRIHQNSLFNGAEQSQGFGQVNQIQQRTVSGNASNPLSAGFGGGFAGGTSMMMGGQGFGQSSSQGFNQGFQNQGYQNQGFQNQVNQNQVDRIHQNSLFNGAEQSQGFGQVNQIQQRTISGNESNPLSAGFGGGFAGGTNMMMGGQGFGQSSGQGFNQGNTQGYQNQVGQNQLQRIHQNSLYNGQSQPSQSTYSGFEQRVQQATMQNGMMANPQVENSSFGGGQSMMGQGFGGGQSMMGQGFGGGQYPGGTFRQVMNADAGITDSEGPSSYPASMYTGHNQYDTVNQSVFNQMNS